MATSPPQWVWSAEYQNYYYVTYGQGNRLVYQWAPKSQPYAAPLPAQDPSHLVPGQAPTSQYQAYNQYGQTPHTHLGQGPHQIQGSAYQQLSLQDQTNRLPNQTRSRTDALHPEYYMRRDHEAHQFFKKGRVFSILWSEPASETRTGHRNEDDMFTEKSAFTIGKHGEAIHQQIRRFVIVRVKRQQHFVYACPITTYGGRATTKPGCNPKKYSIIYMTGTEAQTVRGEIRGGMTKDPIEVEPANEGEYLQKASRLRFDKTYPVEWNVKVKDVGRVVQRDLTKLLKYWKEEHLNDADESDDEEPTGTLNQSTMLYAAPTNASYSAGNQSHPSASPATASWTENYAQTGLSYTLTNADASDITPRTTHALLPQDSFSNTIHSNSNAHSAPQGYSSPNIHPGGFSPSQTYYSPSSYPQNNTSHQPRGSR